MKVLAHIFSILFQPIFVPLYGTIILLSSTPYVLFYTLPQKLLLSSIVFFFTGLVPAFALFLQMRSGAVSDAFISNRKERFLSYLISLMSYMICTYMLYYIGMEFWVVLILAASSLSVLLIFIINYWWKISAHSAGIGGLYGSVFVGSYLLHSNPIMLFVALILVAGCVMSSRIYLEVHTLPQTIAGFLLGVTCTTSVICFF